MFPNKPNVLVNADMGPDEVQAFRQFDEAGRQLLRAAVVQMGLSASLSLRTQAGAHDC